MTREMIFDQLDRTIRKMRTIRMFQVLFDCAVVYGIICVIVDGTRVTLFNQTMVQNKAMIVVLLIGAIDLCLAVIRRNYRSTGMQLSQQFTGRLSDQEMQLVRALERF